MDKLVKRLKSKTFWIALASLVAAALQLFDYGELAAKIPDFLDMIILGGMALGVWKTFDKGSEE